MKSLFVATIALLFGSLGPSPLRASEGMVKTEEIRVRDPFIYADAETKTYYLYAQAANGAGSGFQGVEVYASKDLVNWLPPRPVLTLPDDTDVIMVWAPEVHEYKGAFYLFVTLTSRRELPEKKPVESANWPTMNVRGTHVFRADKPTGPFEPLKTGPHTPENWMALDGTLYVEDGVPYMVFCHEWVQTIDGTMEAVRLADDLSGTVGDPGLLFKASAAPGARRGVRTGKVTDGCFLYRSGKSGKLMMIWSTFLTGKGYSVLVTESESGKIAGPWVKQTPIYEENGGHGMLFRALDGRLMLALHQPNSGAAERLHLFEVVDDGQSLAIREEVSRESLAP